MSSDNNKKSFGSIILFFLIFALIAGLSWFFFNGKKPDLMEAKNGLADKISKGIQSGDDVNEQAVNIEDINAARPDNEPNTDDAFIGIKSIKHDFNPPAIYGERSIGDENAPIHIQEFFSLTCNHCAEFHKGAYQELKQKMIDTGKVYFTYQDFPLNGPALYASMIARCMPEERYVQFVDTLLRQQDDWAFGGNFKEGLKQRAKLMGMSDEDFDACFANKELQKTIGSNIREISDHWKINSTPSFIINNGERVLYGAQTYETFEKLYKQLTGEDVSTSNDNTPSLGLKEMMLDARDKAKETVDGFDPETIESLGKPVEEFNTNAANALSDAVEKTVDKIDSVGGQVVKDTVEGADKLIDNAVKKTMDIKETMEEAIIEEHDALNEY